MHAPLSCMQWRCARGAGDRVSHVELQHSEVRPVEILQARSRSLTAPFVMVGNPCELPADKCATTIIFAQGGEINGADIVVYQGVARALPESVP